jgi:hypothetical protein
MSICIVAIIIYTNEKKEKSIPDFQCHLHRKDEMMKKMHREEFCIEPT